jgi:hypothetical protein
VVLTKYTVEILIKMTSIMYLVVYIHWNVNENYWITMRTVQMKLKNEDAKIWMLQILWYTQISQLVIFFRLTMNNNILYLILPVVQILKTVKEQIFALSKLLVVSTIKIIRKLRSRCSMCTFHLTFLTAHDPWFWMQCIPYSAIHVQYLYDRILILMNKYMWLYF